MIASVVLLRGGAEKMTTSFGLDLCREGFLGWRDGRAVDAGTGQDPRSEIGFSLGPSEASIGVILIEAWPDARAKLLGLGQTRIVCGGCVFQCATSTDASIGNSNAGQPPVLGGHWAAHEATQ